jgi:signal peptidase I
MFAIFSSEQKKMRRSAENWLRLSEKVYHYRRDLLKEREVQELLGASTHLQETLRRDEDASRIRMASERLEDVLRKYGGAYYRKYAWTDNVEVLLVAAILAIGIRTFFVQPFKIPTNSMWPTYHGMTHEIFESREEAPGAAGRLFRGMAYGARRYYVESPAAGELQIAVHRDSPRLAGQRVRGRRWLVFPAEFVEYYLYVGGTPVAVRVPAEFQLESVLRDLFFPEAPAFEYGVAEAVRSGRNVAAGPGGTLLISTGRHVQSAEQLVHFDILTGDQLFVDRASYHFVRPKIGDSIVFRTGEIPGLRGPGGVQEDKYYIKRLVGLPGDTLEIQAPTLLRNGEPIDGRPVFEKINTREGTYTGYAAEGMLAPGRTVRVQENRYYALGDNSANSLDSRAWGFVPEDAVVGRSLFIYYPFTKRWGPAK